MPKIIVIDRDGEPKEYEVDVGQSILEVARRYDIDLEGACEGSLACATCHVYVAPEWFDKLDEPSEEEEDMLDNAFELTATSRLGCQIRITEELDGLVVTLPPERPPL